MAYNFKSQMEVIVSTIPRIYQEIYVPVGEVEIVAYKTKEPVPFSEKESGEFVHVKKDKVWADIWECGWFHITGTVPESAKGKKVVLYLDFNSEVLIVDKQGIPLQGLTSGTCMNISDDLGCFIIRKRVHEITSCAQGGEEIDIWADVGCNYLCGIGESNRPDPGKINHTGICICRDNVKSLFYDFYVLHSLMKTLSQDSARYHRLRQALFDASSELYDFRDEEIEKAAAILKKELDKKCGDEDLTITAIGHSHIDLAWLWPLRETKRKGARTFANTLYYMERDPEYLFGASQPQLYVWVKENYPELYAKVKEKVKDGRWELQGAMWVEPDANLTGGESFVRQILYGKRFFRQEFNQDMEILWLPDVFGYSGALPQILKKSGVSYFMTTKLDWGNRHNKHPHNTFRWKGIDGTEVLVHMPPGGNYNCSVTPEAIRKIETTNKDNAVCDEALVLYGIGDGGGGPGEFHLEMLQREKCLAGTLPVKQGKAIDFFRRIAKKQERYASFSGELYFEMHQGTYTTQAKNKWYNRKMENLLREAEFASVVTGALYPKEKLDEIWREVLLYQFHDILPGSSIKRVYDECVLRYEIMCQETQKLIQDAYGKGDYAINSLSWDRCGWEKIDGKWYCLTVPAMGSVKLENGIVSEERSVSDCSGLENDCVRISFDEDGSILSVYEKNADRDVLKEKSNRLAVYCDNGDAWDMSESYRERAPRYFELLRAEAFVDGPKKGICQEYVFGSSKLWQTVSIVEGSPVVTFETKVDWKESNKMLRTAFYTTMVTGHVTCDTQYGSIRRPAHNNTGLDIAKFEICAHKYADLSDNSYGVALMNDCKYGYCVKEGMLDLNLLRSVKYPNGEAYDIYTDHGIHTFTYALYPHTGNLEQSDVLHKSYELNQPIQVGEKIEQFVTVANPDVVIESVKKAEDSEAIIIRMYETKGGSAKTALNFNKTVKSAYLVDLMEENEKEIDLNNIKFHGFEIVTVKVNL